mmetsp:Transcript_136311/g.237016  ORF Transcript_136311/g.237016 Transcript_136311/m.237016 type:complete len:653 (+) Transcript_136311:61-2019(+)
MKGVAVFLLVSLPWPCALETCVAASVKSEPEQAAGGDLCTFVQLPLTFESRALGKVRETTDPKTLGISTEPLQGLFTTGHVPGGGRILKVVLACALVVFITFGISDLISFRRLLHSDAAEQEEEQEPQRDDASNPRGKQEQEASSPSESLAPPGQTADYAAGDTATVALAQTRSLTSIVGLVVIRLYTGFLSATWLPFLLAMEGQDLWKENQSLFMGVAKLIYGATILLNPILGLLGDRVVAVSHGLGRRLFIRAGVLLSVIGIVTCLKADQNHNFYTFMTGILIWRLGDATVDVTAEVLVPEMVPKSQYELAGGIKAAAFLLGALFGYVLLILFADVHFTWLYYAYLCGMLTCVAPMLLLLGDADGDSPVRATEMMRGRPGLRGMMVQAYVAPAVVPGWLPSFSAASFLFGCGMAPMFFLLLMIRDLVGVASPIALQDHFSACSMLFFVAAAIAALLSATCEPKASGKECSEAEAKIMLSERLRRTALSALSFGLATILLPIACLPNALSTRETIFYVAATALGFVFGSGFAKFQELTWQLMPEDSEVAKASIMGFTVMCRIFGLGIGNFAAGVILDLFPLPGTLPALQKAGNPTSGSNIWFRGAAQPVYRQTGYVVMCCSCTAFCIASSMIVRSIAAGVRAESERPRPAA